jgi:uncharacterized delta-60 repeat protein
VNKKSVLLSLAVILLAGVLNPASLAQPAQEWATRYNGTANSYDYGRAVAADGSGNVFVTGYSTGSGTGYDCVTIKYSSAGAQQWLARFNGTGNSSDYGQAIAVDGSGNVYVTGYTYSGTSYDYLTIKYNSTGDTEWTRTYNGPGNSTDYGQSIAVDGSGNVIVTGYSYTLGPNYNYATIKYSSTGVQQWVAIYNGTGNNADYAWCVKVDGSGNVYVTGYSYAPPHYYDYATVKYNPSGVQQWASTYNGPGNYYDYARSLGLDPSGNVYVTGYSTGLAGNYDCTTIKYNNSGAQQWVAIYDGPGGGNDFGYAIAVDPGGNCYVTGYCTGSTTDYDYATVKYTTAGTREWVSTYNGPGSSSDYAYAIAIDGAGGIYITGGSTGVSTGYDYATVKYDNSGIQQWVMRYTGPGNNTDYGRSIAVDGSGNVFVTGDSYGTGTYSDYATIRYSQFADVYVQTLEFIESHPPGQVWAGAAYTPFDTVGNFGSGTAQTVIVIASMDAWNSTQSITSLASGGKQQMNFPGWTASRVPNTTHVRRDTVYAGAPEDPNSANNKVSASYWVVYDGLTVSIDEPPTNLWAGASYTPKATVKNNSAFGAADFSVTCAITGGWTNTKTVSNLAAGSEIQILFDSWTVTQAGGAIDTVTVICQTTGDINTANNTLTKIVYVKDDVGATEAVAPLDMVYVGSTYNPAAKIKNMTAGNTQGFNIVSWVLDPLGGMVFIDTLFDSLFPNEAKVVTFDDWKVGPDTGVSYEIDVFTELPGDFDTTNNRVSWNVKSALVPDFDVGVASIDEPAGPVKVGEKVTPKATVRNYGALTATFDVQCAIGADTSVKTVTGLAKNTSQELTFKNWTASTPGNFTMMVSTLLSSDVNRKNDTMSVVFAVRGVDEQGPLLPIAFNLEAARPNPTESSVDIYYQLPVTTEVSIGVYDITGKLVKMLVGWPEVAGYKAISWDGKDTIGRWVPNGLYFVRMVTPEYTATKKVVLIK